MISYHVVWLKFPSSISLYAAHNCPAAIVIKTIRPPPVTACSHPSLHDKCGSLNHPPNSHRRFPSRPRQRCGRSSVHAHRLDRRRQTLGAALDETDACRSLSLDRMARGASPSRVFSRDELNHRARRKAWACNAAASKLTASDASMNLLVCHDPVAADWRHALGRKSRESLRWDLQHWRTSACIQDASNGALIPGRAASL
jgi:hypothetical protein